MQSGNFILPYSFKPSPGTRPWTVRPPTQLFAQDHDPQDTISLDESESDEPSSQKQSGSSPWFIADGGSKPP